MSRSYKHRPFMAICGGSAKKDKQLAHRGERRAHKRAINGARKQQDFEDFIPPHRFECRHNDVWGWNRDGNQRHCGLTARDWNRWCEANFFTDSLWYQDEHYMSWPPEWYQRMMRK